jgi:hypothetical protein
MKVRPLLVRDCETMAGRTRRKTAAQARLAITQTEYTGPRRRSESARPKKCYFQQLPNEVLVMIIGCLNLFDLVNMLCVSKWINVYLFSWLLAHDRLYLASLRTRRNFNLQGNALQRPSKLFVKRRRLIRTLRCSFMTYLMPLLINCVRYWSSFQYPI